MIEIRHDKIEGSNSTRAAYNEIYNTRGIILRDSFYIWLIRLLKPEPGKLLVDISCGEGRLPNLALIEGLRSIGLDFAISGLKIGKESSIKTGWAVGDGEFLPIEASSADYVTHIGSLEHYVHPELGVKEIARVLKPGGKACVLLPNGFGLLGNFKHVWQKGDVYDDFQPIQRYNTRWGWHKLLVANGLMPFKTIKYEREWPLTKADLFWYLTNPSKLLRLFIQVFIPVNVSNCIVYLCHKNNSTI